MARTFFVGGNFKMNGLKESIKAIVEQLNAAELPSNVEVVIAPPALYLDWAQTHLKQATVEIAAQNSFDKNTGAYTGEVAVEQIKDVGAKWVILGHSERRTILNETDEFVASKTKFALDNGLGVILCIGELLEERDAGKTIEVVNRQIDAVVEKVKDWSNIVIAYEPVWAIGTGLAATPEDAQAVHAAIRKHLVEVIGAEQAENTRIIYGGSVNGKNAKSFNGAADIDGFLVGGASLKPEFVDIINARQ
ncbi:Triosephosphate isomerase [Lipomyces japonicus]|uniref:Triosephosphate isomerase n=1 Tax=Lipomyces japonicus TaxID=56871 RepID=UPI0034CFD442